MLARYVPLALLLLASASAASAQPADSTGAICPNPFGTRRFECPPPPQGRPGRLVFDIIFDPAGRPLRVTLRSGDERLGRRVRRLLTQCRAEPLPPEASQVPQVGTATFVFTVEGQDGTQGAAAHSGE